MNVQSIQVLSPPGAGARLRGSVQVELGEFAGQVDEGNGDGLGLPLQTQRGAQAMYTYTYTQKERERERERKV